MAVVAAVHKKPEQMAVVVVAGLVLMVVLALEMVEQVIRLALLHHKAIMVEQAQHRIQLLLLTVLVAVAALTLLVLMAQQRKLEMVALEPHQLLAVVP
jgi:hypothetical protein